jgi:hypothetical protein
MYIAAYLKRDLATQIKRFRKIQSTQTAQTVVLDTLTLRVSMGVEELPK